MDIVGMSCENIMLPMLVAEVSWGTIILDSDASMTLQLDWVVVVKKGGGREDEKVFTGAVFLDVAKAFDSVWIQDLLLKLIILQFSHLT